DRNFFSARRTTFATEDLRVLPAGSQEIANDQERSESRLNSYLARVSYSLKDRYLVEANFRRGGSSRFGPANRWGELPRDCRRLQLLRGWSHDQENEVLPGGAGAGSSDGVRA